MIITTTTGKPQHIPICPNRGGQEHDDADARRQADQGDQGLIWGFGLPCSRDESM